MLGPFFACGNKKEKRGRERERKGRNREQEKQRGRESHATCVVPSLWLKRDVVATEDSEGVARYPSSPSSFFDSFSLPFASRRRRHSL